MFEVERLFQLDLVWGESLGNAKSRAKSIKRKEVKRMPHFLLHVPALEVTKNSCFN